MIIVWTFESRHSLLVSQHERWSQNTARSTLLPICHLNKDKLFPSHCNRHVELCFFRLQILYRLHTTGWYMVEFRLWLVNIWLSFILHKVKSFWKKLLLDILSLENKLFSTPRQKIISKNKTYSIYLNWWSDNLYVCA